MPVVLIQAQNLVPNPSFEDITACPTDQGQIYLAEPWFSPYMCSAGSLTICSSSDLFNICYAINNPLYMNVGVPVNTLGYQIPRTGSGYAGIGFWDGNGAREKIETPLSATLVKDSVYCISMYVVNKRPISDLTSTSNLHFLLTKDSLVDSQGFTITTPSVKNPDDNIISDTTNWTKIIGCYIAKGGEKFLTIGSFYDNAHSTVVKENELYFAYYLIDDVSVELSDGINCSCSNNDSTDTIDSLDVPDQSLKQVIFPNVITPNDDKVNDLWIIDFIDSNEYVEVYNRWGNVVAKLNIEHPFWDGTSNGRLCTEGVYFYRAYLRKAYKNGFIQLVR